MTAEEPAPTGGRTGLVVAAGEGEWVALARVAAELRQRYPDLTLGV